MNLPKIIAKARLNYYLNLLDVCNCMYQLKMISDEKADEWNKKNLFEIVDCYTRLGVKLPKECVNFYNERKGL